MADFLAMQKRMPTHHHRQLGLEQRLALDDLRSQKWSVKVVAFAVVSIAVRERLELRKDPVLVPVVVALQRLLAVGLVAAGIVKVEE